jgi:uracil-DNA glycosylase
VARHTPTAFQILSTEARACRVCADPLPHEPRPVFQAGQGARLLIVGQAPGSKVHSGGIPWDDPSGERLRDWLQLDRDHFYDPEFVALLPMGFCYPGKGRSGDLPPRPECAPLWMERFRSQLPRVQLTLAIGRYAQDYLLGDSIRPTLTETVKSFRDYLPRNILPLPHPSPRNNIWLRKNPFFEIDVLPELRRRVSLVR